jgi:hypothetical protein
MVRHSIKGSFRQCIIAASMAVQLAGCGGEDSSFVSSASSAVTASSADSSASSAVPANRTYSSASSAATNGSVTLNWVAPVARADGSPISLADIDGYRVYYGATEGNYTNRIDVNDGTAEEIALRGLTPGTIYIVVTTYDTAGRESAYSDVVIRKI